MYRTGRQVINHAFSAIPLDPGAVWPRSEERLLMVLDGISEAQRLTGHFVRSVYRASFGAGVSDVAVDVGEIATAKLLAVTVADVDQTIVKLGALREMRRNSATLVELGGKRIFAMDCYRRLSRAVLTGSGLDDMVAGGQFEELTLESGDTLTVEVKISTAAATDKFQVRYNSGAWSSETAITGASQSLDYGIDVVFGATTGHTLTDYWTITAKPFGNVRFEVHTTFASPTNVDFLFESDPVAVTSLDATLSIPDEIMVPYIRWRGALARGPAEKVGVFRAQFERACGVETVSVDERTEAGPRESWQTETIAR